MLGVVVRAALPAEGRSGGVDYDSRQPPREGGREAEVREGRWRRLPAAAAAAAAEEAAGGAGPVRAQLLLLKQRSGTSLMGDLYKVCFLIS